MLIREIISEGEVSNEISADLMDFIITYSHDKKDTVPMMGENGIINYLTKLGYNVTPQSIMTLLSNNPFVDIVERTTPEFVKLRATQYDYVSQDEEERSQEKVDKTATKVANNVVKTGNEI